MTEHREYDDRGNLIYAELTLQEFIQLQRDTLNGYVYRKRLSEPIWFRYKYDEYNRVIYYETSYEGVLYQNISGKPYINIRPKEKGILWDWICRYTGPSSFRRLIKRLLARFCRS